MPVLSLPKVLNETQITYRIVKSTCKTHGSEGDVVYGIEVEQSGECYNFIKIDDVCVNKYDVEKLIVKLEQAQVTPDQLLYIVEDYLAELYSY